MRMVSTDLEQTLANLGMKLGKSTEKEVWALCPGHDDTNPNSFSVNRDTGEHFCFACGYRGDSLIDLPMDILGLDAWSAAGWLRENGASLTARIERIRDRTSKKSSGPRTTSGYSLEGEFAVFDDVPDKELKKRRITRDAVDFFEIRWDGNFIIPIKDARTGKLVGWQRRKKPRPKNYPKEMKKSHHLFGAYEFEGSRAIVVESPLDAVRLYSEGYSGVVATFGAVVSVTQKRLIESRSSKLLIAMDNDEAGEISAQDLVEDFARKMPTHIFSYYHVPPADEGGPKDVGDMDSDEIHTGVREAIFAAKRPSTRRVVRR